MELTEASWENPAEPSVFPEMKLGPEGGTPGGQGAEALPALPSGWTQPQGSRLWGRHSRKATVHVFGGLAHSAPPRLLRCVRETPSDPAVHLSDDGASTSNGPAVCAGSVQNRARRGPAPVSSLAWPARPCVLRGQLRGASVPGVVGWAWPVRGGLTSMSVVLLGWLSALFL